MDGISSTLVWESLLRLVGAFYALTAPLVLRAAAMDAMLDTALDMLGSSTPPLQRRVERTRRVILVTNSILVGIGGIWLMALSIVATVIFTVSALVYGAYVLIVAPRFLDPHDGPDNSGRRQTRNALLIYLVATGLVILAHIAGMLSAPADLSKATFWLAFALSVALPAYAGWLLLYPHSRDASGRSPLPDEAAIPFDDADPDDATWQALLVPAWERGVLVDARTFETVKEIEGIDVSDVEWQRMGHWQDLFLTIADHHDPMRQRLLYPERRGELEAAGRAIYERLLTKLPPDRIDFEPLPRAHLPAVFPSAIKLMSDHNSHPLWYDEAGMVGNIDPYDLGLSFALTQDLHAWANEFDLSLNWQDPGGPSRWSSTRRDDHDNRGEALAERLREEFRLTGRDNVAVRHLPISVSSD